MKYFSYFLILVFLIIIPIFASAALKDMCDTGLCETNTETGFNSNLPYFIGNIIRALLGLLGVLILIFILYGGYLWLVSGGNEQMITKAKGILTSAFIGLIIVLAAMAITTFIMEGITGAIRTSSDSSSSTSCATGTNWACSFNDGTGSCSAQGPDCSCWCQ